MPPGTTSAVATDHWAQTCNGVAAIGGVGPDTLVAQARGMPAELAVLIPRQPQAPVEPDSDLHADHPAPPFAIGGQTGLHGCDA